MSKSPTWLLPRREATGESKSRIREDWWHGRGKRNSAHNLIAGSRFYELDERSRTAVETALLLGEPLLVTGEPGTGKTSLAYYLA